jgi:DNA primase
MATKAVGLAIDYDAVRAANSFRDVLERYCGQPLRHGRCRCPIHCGDDSNFAIEPPDGIRGRCWVCGWRGDVIDLVAAMEGIEPAEAARRLAGLAPGPVACTRSPSRSRPGPVRPKAPEAWQDSSWQADVAAIVSEARDTLWRPEGGPALDWLHSRGLANYTIRRFHLGFNPSSFATEPLNVLGFDDQGQNRCIWVARGILLPWLAPESDHDNPKWTGATVRRLMHDMSDPAPDRGGKCSMLTGSKRGYLYPYPTIETTQEGMPAMVVEGELDALVGWQEAGSLAHVVTVGGASQAPNESAMEGLARCPVWLLATDGDAAGCESAWNWRERAPERVRRALLPTGKDLNAFHLAGGDVHEWVQKEIARNAIAPPTRCWREIVVGWPHDRWMSWRNRATDLLPSAPTAEQIRMADHLAYIELTAPNHQGPKAGKECNA